MGTTFGRAAPNKIWKRKKTSNIRRDFDNFRLWSQISLERIDMTKIWKARYQLQPSPIGWKKLGGLWSTNKKVIGVTVDPPKLTIFHETIFWPLGGAAASNFYTCFNPLNCISSQTCGTGRPQVGLCLIFLVKTIAHMHVLTRQHYLRKVCYRYGPMWNCGTLSRLFLAGDSFFLFLNRCVFVDYAFYALFHAFS